MKWRIDSSRNLFKDNWISVRADRCVMPDGAILDPFYLLEYPDWVNIVPVTREGNIVLIRQYRHGSGEVMIEIPCGAVDENDASPADAVKRELMEETGYGCEKIVELCSLYPNSATHTNRAFCYIGIDAYREAEQTLDATEQIEVMELPVDEVRKMLNTFAIGNVLHIANLFYALEYLKRESEG